MKRQITISIFLFALIIWALTGQTQGDDRPSNKHFMREHVSIEKDAKLQDLSVKKADDSLYFGLEYKNDEKGSLFVLEYSPGGEDYQVECTKKGTPIEADLTVHYSLCPVPAKKGGYYRVSKLNENGKTILATLFLEGRVEPLSSSLIK